MRRRLLLLLVVVLAVPALALAAAGDPKQQINPADQRRAAAIVLKRADFGASWKKVPSTPDNDERLTCTGYSPDESDLILTGESLAEFEQPDGIPSALSFSNVYKTKAHAVASWSRSVKPALARCAAQTFKEGVEKSGAKVAIVRQGAFAFPKVAPRTAAFRVVLRISVTQGGETTTIPMTVHLIALGNGRGDAGLITIGLGNGIPTADLRTFAKLTATRLAAAKL